MKQMRVCYEIAGLEQDEHGNDVPVGIQLVFGEINDEEYSHFNYFETFSHVNPIKLLRDLGFNHVASSLKAEDIKLIAPDEYDEKYGDDQPDCEDNWSDDC